MFKSYFLIALRNLKKQKAFSLINIAGMAIGMAVFTLFALTAGVKLRAVFYSYVGSRCDEIFWRRRSCRQSVDA
jgi:hypothetical protein